MTEAARPLDAGPRSWVEAAPAAWRPFLRLARYDRPIGFWLLALPCWQGLALARVGEGFRPSDLGLATLFGLGALAMRGAGCTYNDIVDRDLDAKVARTANRPLPAGQVGLRGAALWLMAQLLVGLGVLLALPRMAQIVALSSVPLVALYPLMKRITWWPQAFLGLVFSWGALVAPAALGVSPIYLSQTLLYAACVLWVIAYDTIYALQDLEDDALAGVKSSARALGGSWRAAGIGFYGLAALALVGALGTSAAPMGWAFGMGAGAVLFFGGIWQARKADPNAPHHALTAFKSNRGLGLAVLAVLLLAAIV